VLDVVVAHGGDGCTLVKCKVLTFSAFSRRLVQKDSSKRTMNASSAAKKEKQPFITSVVSGRKRRRERDTRP